MSSYRSRAKTNIDVLAFTVPSISDKCTPPHIRVYAIATVCELVACRCMLRLAVDQLCCLTSATTCSVWELTRTQHGGQTIVPTPRQRMADGIIDEVSI
jgi:hypothetical protein